MHLNKTLFCCVALATAISSRTPACAALLSPGSTLFPSPVEADPIGGTVIASIVQPVSTPGYTGTLTSEVISGGTNPLGGLTFTYFLRNDISTHSLSRLTVNGYLGSAGFFAADTSYNLAVGNVAPAYIDRSLPGDTIGFSFAGVPVGFGTIAPGQASYLLVVQTNSPTYAQSLASIINGSVQSVTTFSPVPEPSSWLLAVTGLGCVFAYRRLGKASTRIRHSE